MCAQLYHVLCRAMKCDVCAHMDWTGLNGDWLGRLVRIGMARKINRPINQKNKQHQPATTRQMIHYICMKSDGECVRLMVFLCDGWFRTNSKWQSLALSAIRLKPITN